MKKLLVFYDLKKIQSYEELFASFLLQFSRKLRANCYEQILSLNWLQVSFAKPEEKKSAAPHPIVWVGVGSIAIADASDVADGGDRVCVEARGRNESLLAGRAD